MTGRRRRVTRLLAAGILALVIGTAPAAAWAADTQPDPKLAERVQSAIDRGLRWLRSAQKSDGGYAGHLGITALVVQAMARSPRAYREEDGPFMRDSVAYIRRAVKPDGSIKYGGGNEMYTTALSVLALKALGDPKHDEVLKNAQRWIKAQQTDEQNGYRPEEKFYGGFGYGSSLRPDLSNSQYAIDALRASGLGPNDPVFVKAVKFIQRIQNRTESNDQPGALDDGGFAYYPGFSFAGGWTSTGSMTYAGIKSYLYADMDKNDPRIQAAVKWIAKNYTLEENPGLGANGYYYYIDVFARTWAILKTDTVVTADGGKHDWFGELATKLLAEQRPDGSWVNGRSARYWEDRPELCTSHALLALINGLEARAGRK
jgi:squalene-hopene/tetraprenyl-beta-curcumene cyclase